MKVRTAPAGRSDLGTPVCERRLPRVSISGHSRSTTVSARITDSKKSRKRPLGEIGRHARFRILCRKASGFESPSGHHFRGQVSRILAPPAGLRSRQKRTRCLDGPLMTTSSCLNAFRSRPRRSPVAPTMLSRQSHTVRAVLESPCGARLTGSVRTVASPGSPHHSLNVPGTDIHCRSESSGRHTAIRLPASPVPSRSPNRLRRGTDRIRSRTLNPSESCQRIS